MNCDEPRGASETDDPPLSMVCDWLLAQYGLADMAAKRDIVQHLSLDSSPVGRQCARWVVLRLAAALTHRPGYQPTWQSVG